MFVYESYLSKGIYMILIISVSLHTRNAYDDGISANLANEIGDVLLEFLDLRVF